MLVELMYGHMPHRNVHKLSGGLFVRILEARLGVLAFSLAAWSIGIRMPVCSCKSEGSVLCAFSSMALLSSLGKMGKYCPHFQPHRNVVGEENMQQKLCRQGSAQEAISYTSTFCSVSHVTWDIFRFPFLEWTHREKPITPACKLRLRAGRSSAGLSGITIECTCGERRTLGDVFSF